MVQTQRKPQKRKVLLLCFSTWVRSIISLWDLRGSAGVRFMAMPSILTDTKYEASTSRIIKALLTGNNSRTP